MSAQSEKIKRIVAIGRIKEPVLYHFFSSLQTHFNKGQSAYDRTTTPAIQPVSANNADRRDSLTK